MRACCFAIVAPSLLALVVFAASAALAPSFASGWLDAGPSRARIISAGSVDAKTLAGRSDMPAPAQLAGIEIHLDPGWKTYWRTPGDGISAEFDWTGSRNLAAVEVLWPVPRFYRDAAGEYNGYADRVTIPFVLVPENPAKPVALNLQLDYAVCKDICVPVRAEFVVPVSQAPGDAAQRATVLAALARTPFRADSQGICADAMRFADIRAYLGGPKPHVAITMFHADGAPPDLFAEAASGRFLPHPVRAGQTGAGSSLYRLDLSAAGDPQALAGTVITLTAAGAQAGCEIAFTVE